MRFEKNTIDTPCPTIALIVLSETGQDRQTIVHIADLVPLHYVAPALPPFISFVQFRVTNCGERGESPVTKQTKNNAGPGLLGTSWSFWTELVCLEAGGMAEMGPTERHLRSVSATEERRGLMVASARRLAV
ncbi:hypothetical protein CABS01_03843 [Colletotrichum abscissum]|uniref:Uncharacterized protein n=1 Tax=Colletotrichum abscissum TaxID=1671311 RepID=A0A9P9XLM8_9PEZI|nr:uncharacterized protein CABS01_03843 [Colletotrichum abscissum]KAI3556387.1 hypothetical protein CABS02_03247 [Colletotrichum abscissum]KAK1475566.1 hypothetical protein CABS01_03843 [Colletotrichum abscissum]